MDYDINLTAVFFNLAIIKLKNEQLKVRPAFHLTHNKVLQCKNRIATGLSHAFFLGFYVIAPQNFLYTKQQIISRALMHSRYLNTVRAKSVRVERWKPASSSCRPCFFSVSILSLFLRRVVCGGTADVAKVSAAGAALCQSPVASLSAGQDPIWPQPGESIFFVCELQHMLSWEWPHICKIGTQQWRAKKF